MDKNSVIEKLVKAIEDSAGDWGRNQYLLKVIENNREITNSDKEYLEKLLEIDNLTIEEESKATIISKKDKTVFLNPEMVKCRTCQKPINLDEKSIRQQNLWYHKTCHRQTFGDSYKPKEKDTIREKIKVKKDPIQLVLTGAIFVILAGSVYFILGPISMIAMGLGGALTIYHVIGATGKLYSRNKPGARAPSAFLVFLIASPFIIAGMIAFEGYTLLESPVRIILLWAMTISFWSTMLFVPMAVLSKYREDIQPDVKSYPKVSVIIPAYNEEKVIANTIEGLMETKYPKKEIIFVDDGSKDNTLQIAKNYKDQIKVLSKPNGGKATAINYGIQYSTGEIIVIVDADTIIGRQSLREIVKGFEVNEHVAAVAGNIKVRNQKNWITKCQALEYITGIQIVRRAFDVFGSITIVPGALGAFKRSFLTEAGAYGKETIVEDFDQTIKLLKAGLITQGSAKATAYTEAPNTLRDFIAQRKRWYRGNIQVLKRHSDALTNPRYGYLQKLSLPYLFLGMVITPIVGFTSTINAIIGIIMGDWWFVLQVSLIFTTVHYLMTALALRIDGEDQKLLNYVQTQKFEIASHGMGNTPFTEFTIEEQEQKIKESIQNIEEKLDATPQIFIPPQNRFNEDTKRILIENGFTHISSSLLHGDPPPFPLKGETLYRFPEMGTTGEYDLEQNIFVGVPHEKTLSDAVEGLYTYGFAVITSHPQEFSTVVDGTYTNKVNEDQISELKLLIEKIKEKGIKIVPIGMINLDSQLVPNWIKNNAGWWAEGSIDDETFVQGIEYLVQEKIITVTEESQAGSSEQTIPAWIKNNAGWWAEGSIDDETFVQGIEYLVKNGIITY